MRYVIPYHLLGEDRWNRLEIRRKYRLVFGKEISLDKPQTLNEKLQWIKLHDRRDYLTQCADKYAARNIWKQFGEDGLVPLVFHTYNWKDIKPANIPDYPCIVKCNTGCAAYEIIRSKEDVNFRELQKKCRKWLIGNFYYQTQEWQYKNIKPCILVEKLLLDHNGHIPNDYKLHFFNGELQFIYCSIDREGENYRAIYSPQWKRLDFEWLGRELHKGYIGKDIQKPETFERMVTIGAEISKAFDYVRVDFYDVDGHLYYGEITLEHGSGYDTFVPEKYDLQFGRNLLLTHK